METPESIGAYLIPRTGLSLISLHPHPPKLKEVPKVFLQFTGFPVHLPPFQPSHSSTGLYNDCKRSEIDGPHKGSQTSPTPGQLAYQGPISDGSTSEHSDRGRPDIVLRVDNESEVQTQTYSGFLVRVL